MPHNVRDSRQQMLLESRLVDRLASLAGAVCFN
jgi:hypothetical protein